MEGGSIKDLSRYRFDKALSNIAAAKTLFESEDYGFALNRAYYAASDVMRAVNALDGFDSSKPSGVIAHFNQEYVKTGKFPPTASTGKPALFIPTVRRRFVSSGCADFFDRF